MKKIMILGSTGSIGINTLSVIKNHPSLFQVIALVADKNIKILLEQCEFFSPLWVAVTDQKNANLLIIQLKKKHIKTQVLFGKKDICTLSALSEVDYVISAIVGVAGLLPTLSAIQAGKTILLANKESLVTCGNLFMKAVSQSGAKIIPIDSEHSAIFQLLPLEIQKNLGVINLKKSGIKSIILTGSGGPFYNLSLSELSKVTPKQACLHPNWSMGKKISVDSATMMNKGLEYIEAKWLFNSLDSEVEILLHPQSIIHSMICFNDGTVLAQLSIPDISISIAYALSWPHRINCQDQKKFLDFSKNNHLSFFKPDFIRFPCLKLAIDAFSHGQSATIVLNAANEILVAAFLSARISFSKIYEINRDILTSSSFVNPNSIEEVLEIDYKTRKKTKKIISSLSF